MNFISCNITGTQCRVVMMVGWHEVLGGHITSSCDAGSVEALGGEVMGGVMV